jgi:hypothetical protein
MAKDIVPRGSPPTPVSRPLSPPVRQSSPPPTILTSSPQAPPAAASRQRSYPASSSSSRSYSYTPHSKNWTVYDGIVALIAWIKKRFRKKQASEPTPTPVTLLPHEPAPTLSHKPTKTIENKPQIGADIAQTEIRSTRPRRP